MDSSLSYWFKCILLVSNHRPRFHKNCLARMEAPYRMQCIIAKKKSSPIHTMIKLKDSQIVRAKENFKVRQQSAQPKIGTRHQLTDDSFISGTSMHLRLCYILLTMFAFCNKFFWVIWSGNNTIVISVKITLKPKSSFRKAYAIIYP